MVDNLVAGTRENPNPGRFVEADMYDTKDVERVLGRERYGVINPCCADGGV